MRSSWGPLLQLVSVFVVFVSALAAETEGDASSTCSRLANSLGTDVVVTSGDEYNKASTNTYSFFNAEARPSCVVLPRNAEQVQTTMRAIFEDKVHYAVQAGSHSGMRGWNNVDRGVLIYFGHMKDVSYDSAKNTATLQPGILWGEAVEILAPHGVTVMGGRLSDIGTGLLLGGGFSYLSPAHGFSSDAYVELDVVLVDGTLVTATATNEHSDLFRALKGGANRFGIVTRYEVTAFDVGFPGEKNWFGGFIAYAGGALPALLEASAKFVREVNDPNAAILVVLGLQVVNGEVQPVPTVSPIYHGSSLPAEVFGDFLAIPSVLQQVGPLSYSEASSVFGAGADRGSGNLFGASVFASSQDTSQYTDAWTHFQNFTETFKGELASAVLAFTPIPESQIQAGRARGGNVMDPPLRAYAAVQFQTTYLPGVTDISPELEAGRKLFLRQIPPSPGFPLYMNECDASQDVFATYGQYEFLKRTYKTYDPTGFNVRFTDGPRGL